jgi:hypothetical protein
MYGNIMVEHNARILLADSHAGVADSNSSLGVNICARLSMLVGSFRVLDSI